MCVLLHCALDSCLSCIGVGKATSCSTNLQLRRRDEKPIPTSTEYDWIGPYSNGEDEHRVVRIHRMAATVVAEILV